MYVGTAAAFSSAAVKTTVQRVLTKACTMKGVAANDNRCLRLVTGANKVLADKVTAGYFLITRNWLGLLLTLIFSYFTGDKEIEVSNEKTITVDENLTVVKEETKQASAEIPVITDYVFSECVGEFGCSDLADLPVSGDYNNANRVELYGESFRPCTYVKTLSGQYEFSCSSTFNTSLKKLQQLVVQNPNSIPFFETGESVHGLYFKDNILHEFYTHHSYEDSKIFSGYTADVVWKDASGNLNDGRMYFNFYSGFHPDSNPSIESDNANAGAEEYFTGETNVTYPNKPLDEWIEQSNLTADEQSGLLSAEIISEAVDSLWKSAASESDYEGLPYEAGLITPEVVQSVGTVPSIGDAVQPITSTGTSSNPKYDVDLSPDTSTSTVTPDPDPIPDPDPNPNPNPNPDINVDVDVDFGPDPGIDVPTLEDIPTASNILDPIFNLFPVLRNFQVPSSNSGVCPHLQFEMFERSYDISAHCDLLEEQKTVLQSVFSLFWLVMALTILLGA